MVRVVVTATTKNFYAIADTHDVHWCPPPSGWWKFNCDGSGNLLIPACGGCYQMKQVGRFLVFLVISALVQLLRRNYGKSMKD
ncbi:hypothetical protein V6N13_149413 [Hibiscus sabdariffa]|uniref:Uncharacterized protein n=1 Tax=Hibiscus sabdariffa TaxID=183260 RepID=A0ABR2EHE6_9ROSI